MTNKNRIKCKSINTVYEKTAINFLNQVFPKSNNVGSNEKFRNKDFLKINKRVQNEKIK